MGLTAKQARFVEEYPKDLNATQAAIRAGYSEKTARSAGQRLLTHVDIEKALQKQLADRSKRTQIDADWVLLRLGEEVEADLADIYDDEGALRPIREWPPIWRKGLVAGVDVEEILVDGKKIGVVRKIKISDRIKRIELIGKHVHVQAFRDQVQQSGNVNLTVTQEDAEL